MTEPITVETITAKIRGILFTFSGGGKTETGQIIGQININALEMLNLLETSLYMQKDELSNLRKQANRQAKNLERISQGQLL